MLLLVKPAREPGIEERPKLVLMDEDASILSLRALIEDAGGDVRRVRVVTDPARGGGRGLVVDDDGVPAAGVELMRIPLVSDHHPRPSHTRRHGPRQ